MNLVGSLFRSSIGRKLLMAVTGLVLVGFVTGHLVGNLQIFSHPDKINGYAHFLQSLGPVLWLVRIGLLAFIVYHIAHFTVGAAQAGSFKAALAEYTMAGDFHLFGLPIVAKGQHVHDVYSMVYLGFANPVVSLFYIVAVALLSLHLMHGVDSMFQTFGLRNHRWSVGLRRAAALFSLAYLAGNVAIPGAILTGLAKPAAGTTAAKTIAAAAVVTPSVVQR